MRKSMTVSAGLLGVIFMVSALPAQEGGRSSSDPASSGEQGSVIQTPRFDKARFIKWLQEKGADQEVIDSFTNEWEKMGADSGITDRALREVDKAYGKAMALYEKGDPKGALALVTLLSTVKDPVVTSHLRYFLGRLLLDEDDPEGASELFKDFIRFDRGHSVLDAEAAFYLGYSLSLIPNIAGAVINLDAFLQLYPKAAERYRANAHDLLAELKAQWDSPLHGIADDMKHCERKLKKDKTGKEVETKQLDIVEKLTKIIEELEKQGAGGGGAPRGNTQPRGPATSSSLPGGKARIGSLHGSRGVKDAWGAMKDKDREKILAELQRQLPARYRPLIEKYYKKINK